MKYFNSVINNCNAFIFFEITGMQKVKLDKILHFTYETD